LPNALEYFLAPVETFFGVGHPEKVSTGPRKYSRAFGKQKHLWEDPQGKVLRVHQSDRKFSFTKYGPSENAPKPGV
jgi:hypothetical protein